MSNNYPWGGLAPLVNRPGDPTPELERPKRVVRHQHTPRTPSRFPVVENPWGLYPPECAALALYAEGHAARVVGDKLCMAVKTVYAHIEHARGRMNADTLLIAVLMWDRWKRAELDKEMLRHGRDMAAAMREAADLLETLPDNLRGRQPLSDELGGFAYMLDDYLESKK